jgi:predicted ATP-grasp superfamily ATP-dependent carboligase
MVPAVLLGGLDMVRALGLAGIPVLVASPERKPSMASRYCAGAILLPPMAEREACAQALARAGRELAARHGARVPLFYDNDDRLALVQDFRALLEPHFALLLNEPALADALLEKSRFQALAERAGLPVPRRLAWETLGQVAAPVLVKPKTRTGWDASSIRLQLFAGKGKARVFASGAEARAHPLVAQLAPQLSFQEYVAGGDDAIWSFHGFAAPGGEVLEWFVGRKIRTYPALTGDSAYLRLARDGAVLAAGRDIAARLGLAGVFKMDFKRCAATGRLTLLEINARFNLWHYLGAANGVNLPKVAYDYLLHGTRPAHVEARLETRWLALRYDRRARREAGMGLLAWARSLAEAPKVYEVFSWTDPAPLLRHVADRWRERLPRLTARLTRWLSTAS